jgi:hypothetical protein
MGRVRGVGSVGDRVGSVDGEVPWTRGCVRIRRTRALIPTRAGGSRHTLPTPVTSRLAAERRSRQGRLTGEQRERILDVAEHRGTIVHGEAGRSTCGESLLGTVRDERSAHAGYALRTASLVTPRQQPATARGPRR